MTKACSRCGEVKDLLLSFGHDQRNADGRKAACKVCEAESSRVWRQRNPEAVLRQGREKYRRQRVVQPERQAARVAAWRASNQERARELGRLHQRSLKLGRDAQALAYAEVLRADPCSYCGGEAGTIDHIIARRSGGPNGWDNLTAACGTCNPSKGDRSLLRHLLEVW